ncbi:hypothetical protein ERJ70_03295 [Sediminibacillus dalangtanensis]|uniref:Uncharacterized protein n=1 Tax=Sediminibacillus dalangtanensis TaxID=2729421 RepID=A0ABX7VVN9_9BACI|nr:hypothetical protein [Sediminibacillus dalangtanensis]QTM98412.1 hypothetical protein ERJ70_03295 [Sediminibacillus dalangtanensis]
MICKDYKPMGQKCSLHTKRNARVGLSQSNANLMKREKIKTWNYHRLTEEERKGAAVRRVMFIFHPEKNFLSKTSNNFDL